MLRFARLMYDYNLLDSTYTVVMELVLTDANGRVRNASVCSSMYTYLPASLFHPIKLEARHYHESRSVFIMVD